MGPKHHHPQTLDEHRFMYRQLCKLADPGGHSNPTAATFGLSETRAEQLRNTADWLAAGVRRWAPSPE